MHLTICTLAKFNQDQCDDEFGRAWTDAVLSNQALANEMREPIVLDSKQLSFLNGNSIVLLLNDSQGRVARIRQIVKRMANDLSAKFPHRKQGWMHQMPDLFHVTLARVVKIPNDAVDFSLRLQMLLNDFQPITVSFSSLELTRDPGYIVTYPSEVVCVINADTHLRFGVNNNDNSMLLAFCIFLGVAAIGVVIALKGR